MPTEEPHYHACNQLRSKKAPGCCGCKSYFYDHGRSLLANAAKPDRLQIGWRAEAPAPPKLGFFEVSVRRWEHIAIACDPDVERGQKKDAQEHGGH